MHKQHPQTAYRKYAILIGTIFENCDKKDSCVFLFRSCLHFYPLVRASISMTVLYKISFPPVNREKDCFLSVFVVSLFAGKALFRQTQAAMLLPALLHRSLERNEHRRALFEVYSRRFRRREGMPHESCRAVHAFGFHRQLVGAAGRCRPCHVRHCMETLS